MAQQDETRDVLCHAWYVFIFIIKIVTDSSSLLPKALTSIFSFYGTGRSEQLNDVFIAGAFDESKIKCSEDAKKASLLLLAKAINNPVNCKPWAKNCPDESNVLKVSLLNIRSIMAHIEDLKRDSVLLKSDIICLCETWLQPAELESPSVELQGFKLIQCSVGKGKGVAMFVKNSLNIDYIDFEKQPSLQCIQLEINSTSLILGYRSQDCKPTTLKHTLEKRICHDKKILMIGDFNIDVNSSDYQGAFQEIETKFELKQIITKATHEAGHILDLAFTNIESTNCQVTVHQPYYSDHDALCFMLFCDDL